jgi:hypothetical protein
MAGSRGGVQPDATRVFGLFDSFHAGAGIQDRQEGCRILDSDPASTYLTHIGAVPDKCQVDIQALFLP